MRSYLEFVDRDNYRPGFRICLRLILCYLVYTPLPAIGQSVEITDRGLLIVFSIATGKPPSLLTLSDVEKVEYLNASGRGIKSIRGIEAAKNLVTLDLSNNRLTDVTIPSGLKKLEHLNLSSSRLKSLNLPTGLTRLKTLNLNHNHLTSLSIPSDALKLNSLSVEGNPLRMLKIPEAIDLSDLSLSDLASDLVRIEDAESDSPFSITPKGTLEHYRSGKLVVTYVPTTRTTQVGVIANDDREYLVEASNLDGQGWSAISPSGTARELNLISDSASLGQAARFYRLLEGPRVNIQPESVSVSAGDSVTFNVTGSGTSPLTYEWYLNGTLIRSGPSSTLEIENANESNEGHYSVSIVNRVGTAESKQATLSISRPLSIATQPKDQTLTEGDALTLAVAASGEGLLKFQWFKDGAPIPGETSSSLSILVASPKDSGIYNVHISNLNSSLASRQVQVIVTERLLTPESLIGYTFLIKTQSDFTDVSPWSPVSPRADQLDWGQLLGPELFLTFSENIRFIFHYAEQKFAVFPSNGLGGALVSSYSYERISGSTAKLEFASSQENSTVATFMFSSDAQGSFEAMRTNVNGSKNGSFLVENPASEGQSFAPTRIDSQRLHLGVTRRSGSLPGFGPGNFRISLKGTSDFGSSSNGRYNITPSGSRLTTSIGKFEYHHTSRTSATLITVDDDLSNVIETELTFFNLSGGTFFQKLTETTHHQAGVFLLE